MAGDRPTQVLVGFLCFTCIFGVLVPVALAEPVDASRAAMAANGWYELRFRQPQEQQPVEGEVIPAFTEPEARPLVVKGTTIGYAFDTAEGGCIAIAADDELAPVFYYSLDSSLDVPGVPAAQAIMEAFADTISELQSTRTRKTGPGHAFWGLLEQLADLPEDLWPLAELPSGPVGPLLTTRWNQTAPYHDKCPVVGREHCYVGCTATAMAQIMRYWKHPKTGTGSHSYNWSGTVLSADFGSTTYDWANMPEWATPLSDQAVKDALSTLSYHCGVSVDMNYGQDGSSGAMRGDALTQYFGYLTTSGVWKSGYSDDGWLALMREQVDKGWPVWYSIENHALVMDGYDSPNLVHLNMGWGGHDDGFWSLQQYPPVYAVVNIRPDRPAISRDPIWLENSCWKGKNAPDQSFQVWNSGGGTLEYSITDEVSWLSCNPTSGTSAGDRDTIVITYATSGLSVGSYSTSVRINPVGVTITPQSVRVNLAVTEPPPPAISVNTTGLSASCIEGKNAAEQSFEVWNSGGKTLNYSISDNVSWLTCNPVSGSSTGEHDAITVSFATSGLSPGAYSGAITIGASGASNTPQTIVVTLAVTPPAICCSVESLRNTCQAGSNAALQSFEVWTSGPKALNYSIGDDASWLSCSPTTGGSAGEHDTITVNYASSGLSSGVYSAAITITAPRAGNSPQTIPLLLTVAGTRYVDGSVGASGDGRSWGTAFKTIQQAIDAAYEGETVIVAQGIYVENICFKGKNIVLRSVGPSDPAVVADTIIDGAGSGSVVTFDGTENETCLLSGFTIRNGTGPADSGVKGSSSVGLGDAPRTHATIRNNIITGNSTWWHGGGITWCGGTIENNTIMANSALSGGSGGGGLAWCNGTIRNNVIVGNSATGQNSFGGGLAWCDGVVRNNVIAGNTANNVGGGLWGCGGAVHNNTIVGNAAATGGGLSSCNGSIMNCIIWGNTAPSAAQLHDSSAPGYSCIQGWTGGGEGNIAEHPGLLDVDGADNNPLGYEDNDYRLSTESPCIDAGKNEDWMRRANDIDGNLRIFDGGRSLTVDMGAYEFGSLPFRVLSVVSATGGGTELTWYSRPGDSYVIWSSANLLGGQWVSIATIPSEGDTTSWTDSSTSGRMKLYRIEIR